MSKLQNGLGCIRNTLLLSKWCMNPSSRKSIEEGSTRRLHVSDYFMKVKSPWCEIAPLDPDSKVSEAMRRIVIHGLNLAYDGYIIGVCGWQTQPTLLELESLLVEKDILVKQMVDFSLKSEDEAFFSHKERRKSRGETSKQLRKGGWWRSQEGVNTQATDSKIEIKKIIKRSIKMKHATTVISKATLQEIIGARGDQ